MGDVLQWSKVLPPLSDDFLIITQGYEAAQTALQITLSICETLHFPVASEKAVGPSTALTFLGIQIDTVAGTVSLPPEKLHQLHVLLEQWMNRRAPIKRDLLSLLGHLSHAATVIPPGHTFVRHLTEAASQVRALHHHVRLNVQCWADLQWWLMFDLTWGGVALWPPARPSISCVSDAYGSWGCGATLPSLTKPPCFQLQWPTNWENEHISAKEIVPIVLTAALWDRSWLQSRVLFHSDNSQVVTAITTGSSRNKSLAHLHVVHCLFFLSAAWGFAASSHAHPQPAERSSGCIITKPSSVQALYGRGIAESTNKSYMSEKRRYLDFCRTANLPPLPLSERVMCPFVAHLAETGYNMHPSSITWQQPATCRSQLVYLLHHTFQDWYMY